MHDQAMLQAPGFPQSLPAMPLQFSKYESWCIWPTCTGWDILHVVYTMNNLKMKLMYNVFYQTELHLLLHTFQDTSLSHPAWTPFPFPSPGFYFVCLVNCKVSWKICNNHVVLLNSLTDKSLLSYVKLRPHLLGGNLHLLNSYIIS